MILGLSSGETSFLCGANLGGTRLSTGYKGVWLKHLFGIAGWDGVAMKTKCNAAPPFTLSSVRLEVCRQLYGRGRCRNPHAHAIREGSPFVSWWFVAGSSWLESGVAVARGRLQGARLSLPGETESGNAGEQPDKG